MRRTAIVTLVLVLALTGRAAAAGWHSEQPPGPAGTPIGLGAVGDIAFRAPNRGMLITAGNDAVAPGLFAYDGSGWYRYATVCGGHGGRIAWAGRNEFWTISDQRAGQQTTGGSADQFERRSLCHFVDGRVVASYAEPVGAPGQYEQMNAAACSGPSDCWFAGEKLPGTTNDGAFHLHWDGSTLTAIPSLTELQPDSADPSRAVASLATIGGAWLESVTVAADDDVPGESEQQPFVLHSIDLASSSPFTPLLTAEPIDRGPDAAPADLAGLRLSTDGTQLWAVAGDAGRGRAQLVALRRGDDGSFAQLSVADPGHRLAVGDRVLGLAAVPGSDSAWVAYAHAADDPGSAPARLIRLAADGSIADAAEGIGRKGVAGPLACPAPDQCWMATSEGWLFHRGDPPQRDDDPVLHQLVSFRPADDGVPAQLPDSIPADTSGADPGSDQIETPSRSPTPSGGATTTTPATTRTGALVTRVRSRLVGRTTLALSFTLRARATVRVLATRRKRTVAKTRRYTLGRGRHTVHLRLNTRRWPTGLRIDAAAVGSGGGSAPAPEADPQTDSSGQPITVTTRAAVPPRP